MRRLLAALLLALVTATSLTACGESGKPEADKTAGPGMNKTENLATGTEFFQAIASNDAAQLEAARALVAPESRALTYLNLVIDGLPATPAAADTLTENNGRFRICKAEAAKTCVSYAAVVLVDGKVNDFTVDGKKIRVR